MTTSSSEMRALARRITGLEAEVRGLSAGPQLAYSSIEDGGINEYSADGILMSRTGRQYDGTSVSASLNGPPPPQPSAPVLAVFGGGLTVLWDGMWAPGPTTTAPMDFSRVEIHVHSAAFDPATSPHLLATIESPRGATVVLSLPMVLQYVRLVAVSASGKYSIASAQVSATPLPFADTTAIQNALDAYKWIKWSASDPIPGSDVGSAVGSMWWKRDGAGKVVAQWEWDGTLWQPREVSGLMIAADSIAAINLQADSVDARNLRASSVTAGKIAALAVEAGTIAANAITATEISAGAIDGQTITGATLQSSKPGSGLDRIIADGQGLRLENELGVPTTNLATDPSQISTFDGQIRAQGLTIEGNMLVNGMTNNFGAGSITSMQKEISNSGLAPSISMTWDMVSFGDSLQEGRQSGIYDATSNEYHIGYDYLGKNVISHKPDGSMGLVNMRLGVLDGVGDNLAHGMTKMPGGGDYYTLGAKKGQTGTWIERYSGTTGMKVSDWKFNVGDITYGVIGNDGTSLLISFTDPATFRILIYRLHPATYANVGTTPLIGGYGNKATMETYGLYGKKLNSVMYGNFDFGSPRYVIGVRGAGNAPVLSYVNATGTNSLTQQTNEIFAQPAEPMSAFFWNSAEGGFRSMSSTLPHIVKHAAMTWTTASSKWWASSSYYQTANGYETTHGPRVTWTMWKRCNLTVVSPPIPSTGNPATDPNAAKCFVGLGAVDPGVTVTLGTVPGMWNSKGVPAVGQVSQSWGVLPFSGSNPISPNTFPLTAPAVLQSAAKRQDNVTPVWRLGGDGSFWHEGFGTYTTFGVTPESSFATVAGTIVTSIIVPATSVARMLHVDATLLIQAGSAADSWEGLLNWGSPVVTTNVFDRYRFIATAASQSGNLSGLVAQPANTSITIRMWARRWQGTATTATGSADSSFANINIVAYPA